MDFDVIIVGGGIAGASLGAALGARRRTLIVEAEEQCGYHTTGRSAAFWLAHYGGPEVMPLTLASGPMHHPRSALCGIARSAGRQLDRSAAFRAHAARTRTKDSRPAERLGFRSRRSELRRYRRRWPAPGVPCALPAKRRADPVLDASRVGASDG